ncbi:MAG: hypothetical protein ACSLFJ_07545 [Immundisolibacter sp.]|uniref:hypothetical protein n=1 Tax=Immundisolibacter sp. TaxID=1934948 RepID=UPI003EDE9B89
MTADAADGRLLAAESARSLAGGAVISTGVAVCSAESSSAVSVATAAWLNQTAATTSAATGTHQYEPVPGRTRVKNGVKVFFTASVSGIAIAFSFSVNPFAT